MTSPFDRLHVSVKAHIFNFVDLDDFEPVCKEWYRAASRDKRNDQQRHIDRNLGDGLAHIQLFLRAVHSSGPVRCLQRSAEGHLYDLRIKPNEEMGGPHRSAHLGSGIDVWKGISRTPLDCLASRACLKLFRFGKDNQEVLFSVNIKRKQILMRSIPSHTCIQTFDHPRVIDAVPLSERLVSASLEEIRVWDIASAKLLATHQREDVTPYLRLAALPCGKRVAELGEECINVYSLDALSSPGRFPINARCLTTTPLGSILAGTSSGAVVSINPDTLEANAVLHLFSGKIDHIACSSRGQIFCTYRKENSNAISILELRKSFFRQRALLQTNSKLNPPEISALLATETGFVIGGHDGSIAEFDFSRPPEESIHSSLLFHYLAEGTTRFLSRIRRDQRIIFSKSDPNDREKIIENYKRRYLLPLLALRAGKD